MSQTGLKILLAVAVVATAVALFFGQREQARYGLAESQALAPELDGNLADVDSLQLHAAGKEPFTVLRQHGEWIVPDRGGYPADTAVLRRELRKFVDAKKLEPKTAVAANYAQLGVEDIESAEDTTVQLTAKAGDSTVLNLLIGKSGSSGSYVREVGQAQSWLADTRFSPPKDISSWLDRELVDLDRSTLRSVSVKPADGKAYSLEKTSEEQQDFALTPAPPEGRELNFANLNRVGAALANLRLKDVVTELPEDLAWNRTEYRRFDGLVVQARSARHGEDRLVQLSARFDAPPAPETDTDSDSTDDAPASPAPTSNPEQRAEEINNRVEGWTYIVSNYNADALSLDYDFMLKALPEPATDAE